MEPTLHNESLRIIASLHHDGVVQAIQRNELVAALADAVLVPYAAAGGKAESTAKNILARGQPLFTFADENNAHLIRVGARRYELGSVMAEQSVGIDFPQGGWRGCPKTPGIGAQEEVRHADI
jgi:hypothetical protein